MKKQLRLTAFILLAIVLLLATGVAWKFFSSARSDAQTTLVSELKMQPAKPALGDMVSLQAQFRCPWGTVPSGTAITPGEGTQTAKNPKLSLKGLSWGTSLYELNAAIQPVRTGDCAEGSLQVSFSKPKRMPESFTLKIPAFKAEPLKVKPDEKLAIAGKLAKPLPRWPFVLAGALLLLVLALGAWLLWRRMHVKLPPPTAWEAALSAIDTLRKRLETEPASAAKSLAELSDILRRYLEARFKLHARTQTSREFLSSLDRGDSPLTSAQRTFLKEFINAADMVKFALAAADRKLLEDALQKAERLVRESIPVEPKKGAAK